SRTSGSASQDVSASTTTSKRKDRSMKVPRGSGCEALSVCWCQQRAPLSADRVQDVHDGAGQVPWLQTALLDAEAGRVAGGFDLERQGPDCLGVEVDSVVLALEADLHVCHVLFDGGYTLRACQQPQPGQVHEGLHLLRERPVRLSQLPGDPPHLCQAVRL